MRPAIVAAFVVGAVAGASGMMLPAIARHLHAHFQGAASGSAAPGGGLTHAEKRFEFVANAPMEVVAPLFGAWKERGWAPGWAPEFVWPALNGARADAEQVDRAGMVFKIAHGHTHAVWVNTAFDLRGGRIQYAYVIPDAMVTLITLRLTPEGERTRVEVEYDRTALSAELNAHVEQMADGDAKAGPEWEQQIDRYLAKQKELHSGRP